MMADAPTRKVDPTTLTVVWNSLISICEEMGSVLRRSAFSEAVREGEDFSAGLFNRNGHLIAQGNFTPGHLGSMPYVIENVLKYIPLEELHAGDMLITNDPWIGSGHFPDIYMVAPAFDGNDHIGYAVNIAHHVDVGGAVPGSQSIPGVSEAFQEGLRILPVKLIRKGVVDEGVLRLILGNVRIPEKVRGDLLAQRNANHVGMERLKEIFNRYGARQMHDVINEIFTRSEQRTRQLIEAIPDGMYSYEDYLDDAGPGTDPIKVAVDITVSADEVKVDFSRSSDQVAAGLNSYINFTRAYGMFITKIFAQVDVPHNYGVERPIVTTARANSFFNPTFPAPSSGRACVQIRTFDAMNGAFSAVLPLRAMGASSHWANPNFSSIDERTGKRWVMYDLIFGGYGGQATKDGVEGLCPVFNCGNIPIEVQEANYPAIVHRFEFIPDTGGAGKHRGGCGIRKDIEILAPRSMVTLLGDRQLFAPYGLFGGKDGVKGATVLIRDGKESPLGSKEMCDLRSGDVVSFRLAGAGGYGQPAQRDIKLIQADIENGWVSREAALSVYPQIAAHAGPNTQKAGKAGPIA